jgi:RNA polymerase sigma-70 factor, ECF subfamily
MSELILQFDQIFRNNYSLLCNVANSIVRNEKNSEDIVQDVFLKFWRRKDTALEISNLKGYLYKATVNASIDFLSRNRHRVSLEEIKLRPPVSAGDPSTEMQRKELESDVEKAINRLPPRCKAIFVLSRFEGLKYREIAAHLDISEKTVENQMGIALERLRSDLRRHLTREFISFILSAGIFFSPVSFF